MADPMHLMCTCACAGRSRKQKVELEQSHVMEKLHVNGKDYVYKQVRYKCCSSCSQGCS